MDMSPFVVPKSDQLNADDLTSPITVRITKVIGTGNADQPVSVHFEDDYGRPYKPCKSMRRVMIAAWGVDASQYVGRSMTLYRDPAVMFGGMQVGGVRISHMSHMDRPLNLALTVTKAKRAPYKVMPIVPEQTFNPQDNRRYGGSMPKNEAGGSPSSRPPAVDPKPAAADVTKGADPSDHGGTGNGGRAPSAWESAPLEPNEKARIPLVYPESGETRYFASASAWLAMLTTLADVHNYAQLWDANVEAFAKLKAAAKSPGLLAALNGVKDRFAELDKESAQLGRLVDNLGV